MFTRILIPTDFSPSSVEAAQLARRLAAPGASFRVVHVVPEPLYIPLLRQEDKDLYERAAEAGRGTVGDRMTQFLEAAGLPGAETRVRKGAVAREVSAEARDFHADVVVVGGRRPGAVERFLLGSKAASILRRVEAPLLVGRPTLRMEGGEGFRRIVVATDFYEAAESAGNAARLLHEETGAELFALHVADPSIWGAVLTPTDHLVPGPGAVPVNREWLERTVRDMLHKYNENVLGGRAEEVMVPGSPVDEVVAFARERDVDLVVMGTHGPGAVERALLGSVAEGVAQRAPCSVLITRPPLGPSR